MEPIIISTGPDLLHTKTTRAVGGTWGGNGILSAEIASFGIPNLVWMAYDYTAGSYEGNGIAYAFDGEKYYERSLGHCSCYGPLDRDNGGWDTLTRKDLMMQIGNDDGNYSSLAQAVKSLLEVNHDASN